MVNKYNLHILILIILILGLASTVTAGPVSDKDITFKFHISQESLSDGEWKIYFISVGEFEKDNWTLDTYSHTILDNYINLKKNCGNDGTFYEIIYKMSEEEKQHKGCVVNGTYQEEYCFKTISNNPLCSDLIPYKINDQNRLDFGSYYNSNMWDIKRADFYNHFELSYCNIINNSCTFKIHKAESPYNPYIIILERINSTNDVYFSGRTNINDVDLFYNESLFACSDSGCDVNIDVELNLLTFEMQNSNKLIIEFDNQSEINYPNLTYSPNTAEARVFFTIINNKERDSLFYRIILWFKSIFN